jgi:uncharacterized protein YjbJ (UPF0337 family)
MSITDKLKHTAQELEGKAKQAVGGATGHRKTQAKGLKDEKIGQIKGVGDKLKDATQ